MNLLQIGINGPFDGLKRDKPVEWRTRLVEKRDFWMIFNFFGAWCSSYAQCEALFRNII